MLETASPPTFYLPPAGVDTSLLRRGPGASFCEWKGLARYWDLESARDSIRGAVWSYPEPFPEFDVLKDHVAFYPAAVRCTVDGEPVRAQPGGFYGGWVTNDIVGPFKGDPGTESW